MIVKIITLKEIMNREKDNQKNIVPQWQSEKMKTLIAERWQEVWQIVAAREQNRNQGHC